jgi:uncharacterized protein with HEPN domain
MRDSCVAIADYVGRGRSTFDADPAVRDAILYQVVVLGEAAKGALQADPSLATELPEIEWSPLARMRDRVAHHYWATDREVVWATATIEVPALHDTLTRALARLT